MMDLEKLNEPDVIKLAQHLITEQRIDHFFEFVTLEDFWNIDVFQNIVKYFLKKHL